MFSDLNSESCALFVIPLPCLCEVNMLYLSITIFFLEVFDSERTASYLFGAQLVYKRFTTKTAQKPETLGRQIPE